MEVIQYLKNSYQINNLVIQAMVEICKRELH